MSSVSRTSQISPIVRIAFIYELPSEMPAGIEPASLKQ